MTGKLAHHATIFVSVKRLSRPFKRKKSSSKTVNLFMMFGDKKLTSTAKETISRFYQRVQVKRLENRGFMLRKPIAL